MNIYAVSSAAVCICLIIISVREVNKSAAHIMQVGAGLVIMIALIPSIKSVVEEISAFAKISRETSRFIEPILKITGISYITELSAQLCADVGENTIASRIELAGKIAICLITLPIAREAFIKITEIIN